MDRKCLRWNVPDCDGVGIPFAEYGGIEYVECPKCHLIYVCFL
jgi:hypothetical protein